jgi:hypothetical protein
MPKMRHGRDRMLLLSELFVRDARLDGSERRKPVRTFYSPNVISNPADIPFDVLAIASTVQYVRLSSRSIP